MTDRFIIVDGYPEKSRQEFNAVGMTLAGDLYAKMLKKYCPDALYDIFCSSDDDVELPSGKDIDEYTGVLWPGCNLTVYHEDDPRVIKMLKLCDEAYEKGIPQFGSCWGIQIAVYVAGGEVKINPGGREMGIGRKITLTEKGKVHPMYEGKPHVFDHFVSHDDEVTALPEGAVLLAGNSFSHIQAVEVTYKKGVFWGVQYHPEYDLLELARLTMARERKLTELGYFKGHDDFTEYLERLEELHNSPQRKDLRWQLGIDDDLISDDIRQCEFKNWIKTFFKYC